MPAQPRLSEEVWVSALDLTTKYPTDNDVRMLAQLAADLHYGTELALAHINRGVSGENARRLLREYERMKARIQTAATP